MRRLALMLLLPALAFASNDPYLAETRVQNDLETALSRIVPREQFLVHVDTQVTTRNERKPIETELVETRLDPAAAAASRAPASPPSPPIPMPGFVAEPEDSEEKAPPAPPALPPTQTRNVYRIVETPVLTAVRVHVTLDEAIAPDVLGKVKRLVQDYLSSGYRNQASVVFSQIPMLKPPATTKAEPVVKDVPNERKIAEAMPIVTGEEERLWAYARWFQLALMALAVLAIWRLGVVWKNRPFVRRPAVAAALPAAARPAPVADSLETLFHRHDAGAVSKKGKDDGTIVANLLRRQMLDRFLVRSDAFRLYYLRLLDAERQEICVALKGPAFDALMDNLGLKQSSGGELNAEDLEERLRFHEKSFDEFVAEEDWENGQLFGFLNRLTDEQINFLANHESPVAACLLLRFLKPAEAAFVLDSMSPTRRREVLHEAGRIPDTPFSVIAEIEQRLRAAVRKMPAHLFGTKHRDIQFWGDVLSETQDQDTLLAEIQDARPDMYPSLQKFRFRLDDISALPTEMVRRVLGDADNELLGMALAGCAKPSAEAIFALLPTKRAEMLRNQMGAYRGIGPDRIVAAKTTLTKRLREAIV